MVKSDLTWVFVCALIATIGSGCIALAPESASEVGSGAAAALKLKLKRISGTTREGSLLGFRVTGTGLAADAEILWDYGDGVSRTATTTDEHVYEQDGRYEIRAHETVTGAVATLAVNVANVVPAFTVPTRVDWVGNHTFYRDIEVTDPGTRDALTAQVDWGDGSMEAIPIERGILSLSHFYGSGSFPIRISVSDGQQTSATRTMTVAATAQQVVALRTTLPTWAAVGDVVEGRVQANPVVPAEITLRLTSAPAGAVLGPDGRLTWTPTAAGTQRFVIAASDVIEATGATVTSTLTHTVVVSRLQEQARQMISASLGGVVEVTNTRSAIYGARLSIPPGALAADREIALATVATPPPPTEEATLGSVVRVVPSDVTFQIAPRLTLPFDARRVPAGSGVTIQTYAQPTGREESGGWMDVAAGSTSDAAGLAEPAMAASEEDLEEPEDDGAAGGARAALVAPALAEVEFLIGSTFRLAVIRRGPQATYLTPHFAIWFFTQEPFAPSASYSNAGRGGYRDDVPDFVEDLGYFLEVAYGRYAAEGYFVRPAPERTNVRVQSYDAPCRPGDSGCAVSVGAFELFFISRRLGNSIYLRTIAAHELFHVLQTRAIDDVSPVGRLLGDYALSKSDWLWLDEATATAKAVEVFPEASGYWGAGDSYLCETDITGAADRGYEAFPAFLFTQAHLGVDLIHLLYSRATAELRSVILAGVNETGQQYVYRRLQQRLGSRHPFEAWADFGLAYQNTGDERYLPHAPTWHATSISLRSIPNRLTGRERLNPQAGEDPPVALRARAVRSVEIGLDRGSVGTFAIAPVCLRDEDCAARLAALPGSVGYTLAIRPQITGRNVQYAVFIVDPDDPTDLERIGIYNQSEPFVDVPLDRFTVKPTRQVVIAFVHDPSSSTPVSTVSVDAYFRPSGEPVRIAWDGVYHGCMLMADGQVSCWGPDTTSGLTVAFGPRSFAAGGVSLFSSGGIAILRNDSTAMALRFQNGSPLPAPTALPLPTTGRPVIGGAQHGSTTCVIDDEGGVRCNGSPWTNWTAIAGLGRVTHIQSGGQSATGTPFSLGGPRYYLVRNDIGDVYWFPIVSSPTPTRVNLARPAASIAGGHHACAVLDNGAVHCWGANGSGEIGWGTVGPGVLSPRAVQLEGGGPLMNAVEVTVGYTHSCAVCVDGSLYCWGSRLDCALGDGCAGVNLTEQRDLSVPRARRALVDNVRSVASRFKTVCAIRRDNSVWCWGDDTYGSVGTGGFDGDHSGWFMRGSPPHGVAQGVPVRIF